MNIRISPLAAARLNILLHWEGEGEHLAVRLVPLTSGCGTSSFTLELTEVRPDDLVIWAEGVPFTCPKSEKTWLNRPLFHPSSPSPLPRRLLSSKIQPKLKGEQENVIPWLIAIGVGIAGSFGYFLWIRVSTFDGKRFVPIPRQGAIILGASLEGHRPSPALKERLAQALELYQRDLAPILILSGGSPRGSIPEALVMMEYLVERGVRKQDLILEDRSTNTAENLIHSRKVLFSHDIQDVYLVTHDFHMYRAIRCARRAKLSVTPAPVASRSLWMPYHKTRECLALIKDSFVN